MRYNTYLFLIFASIGFIFLKSGWGKLMGGKFVLTLGDTLRKFALENPYPLVKGFLESVAIPNSTLFGYLTMWGELFAGASLLVLSLYIILNHKVSKMIYPILGLGLITGVFLNLVFWLSAGWTSSSTDSLNLVMFLVQLIGLIFVFQLYFEKSKKS